MPILIVFTPTKRLALGGVLTSFGGDGRKISVCQCPPQEVWRWRAGMDLVDGSSGSLLQLLYSGTGKFKGVQAK